MTDILWTLYYFWLTCGLITLCSLTRESYMNIEMTREFWKEQPAFGLLMSPLCTAILGPIGLLISLSIDESEPVRP